MELLPAIQSIVFQQDRVSISVAHHACQTLELLRCETLELSATDMWPHNGPDLGPIEGLHERTKHLDIFLFFCPSLYGALFPMFCLLVKGECHILVF